MDRKTLNIVLIGMPGSGKTTIGKLLADKLNRKFIDVDSYIEANEKMSISEIFSKGEQYFRDLESQAVKDLSCSKGIIISTGGGIVKRAENMEVLKRNSLIVFIDRTVENILSDINTDTRPLLSGKSEALYNLYKERYTLYKRYKDLEIDNVGTLDKLIEELLDKLQTYISNN